MSISKRLRFEVFRRDGYACVYCGRRAPSVNLEADHKIPRCMGGKDTLDNLLTACWDCNRGKGPLEFEGSRLEGWEYDYESWEHWATENQEDPWPDLLPRWMTCSQERTPVKLDFDIYAAAAELAAAEHVLTMTPRAVFRRAEAF